jgi:plasmid stability protein
MPAFLVKDLPPVLHERLRQEATRHHRSMNREVIAILEKELAVARPVELPTPVKPLVPVNGRWIADAIRKARDSRS